MQRIWNVGELKNKILNKEVFYSPSDNSYYTRHNFGTLANMTGIPFGLVGKTVQYCLDRGFTVQDWMIANPIKENKPEQKLGFKLDDNKHMMSLIPTSFLKGVAEVMTDGLKTYPEDNWKRGMFYSRLYNATQRHLQSWFSGETLDPKSGKNHLYHAASNLAMLSWLQENRSDLDDRENVKDKRILNEKDAVKKGNETVEIENESMEQGLFCQEIKSKEGK